MDVELVKTWQELLSDAVVAHDIEHCAQQLSQKYDLVTCAPSSFCVELTR